LKEFSVGDLSVPAECQDKNYEVVEGSKVNYGGPQTIKLKGKDKLMELSCSIVIREVSADDGI
jgi:hypothetical protein